MIKRVKIFIDVCMVILLILLFPAAKISPPLHVFLGFILIAVIIIHLLLNGKWLFVSIRNLLSGKLNSKMRYMLTLVIGLMIAFSICISTGIIIYQSDWYSSLHAFRGGINPSIKFLYGLHGMSAVACVVLTILHAKVHWGYIKSCFRREKR